MSGVAGPRIWYSLSDQVTFAAFAKTFTTFQHRFEAI